MRNKEMRNKLYGAVGLQKPKSFYLEDDNELSICFGLI